MKQKPHIHVSCAVIERRGRILITQRLPGDSFGGYWEFPGGKQEPEESMEQCLVREVAEELAICIEPRHFLGRVDHAYAERNVSLYFYICRWKYGNPVKHECLAFEWVPLKKLRSYFFPPADADVINELIRKRHYFFGRED